MPAPRWRRRWRSCTAVILPRRAAALNRAGRRTRAPPEPDDAPMTPLSYRTHAAETARLALPVVVARSGLLVMFTVDTMMAGRAGGLELAAIGMGTTPFVVLTFVAIGALQSVVVLVSQAIGAGETARTGAILRAGLAHAALLGLVVWAMSAGAESFFLFTGQTPALSAAAASVAHQFAWGVVGMLLFVAVNLFLEATGRPRVGVVLMVIANVLNVPLNAVFGLGAFGLVEPAGAAGVVAVSSGLRWVVFALALLVLVADERRRGDPHGFRAGAAVWLAEARGGFGGLGATIRRVGLPMGLAQGVESAAFATIMFIAGHLGAEVVGAHQVTMTLLSLVYMAAIGMAGATAIRVGNAVGAGATADVRRAGLTGIGLSAFVPIPVSIAFALVPGAIAAGFTADPAVVAVATAMLTLAAIVPSFDAMMGVVMGALRGTGDVWVPTLLQASAFWLVAVPVAHAASGPFGLGAPGLIVGIFAGILASIGVLVPRFLVVSGRSIRRL